MAELMAQFAARRDARRPMKDQRIADPAAMGVLLVAAQRRICRHRPTHGEVRMGIRAADGVDARQFFRHDLGTKIVGSHRVYHSQGTAFLARAIVREHQQNRVLELPGSAQKVDQASDVLVGMIEHGRIRCLQPGKYAALVAPDRIPGSDQIIAWRHARVPRNDAEVFL